MPEYVVTQRGNHWAVGLPGDEVPSRRFKTQEQAEQWVQAQVSRDVLYSPEPGNPLIEWMNLDQLASALGEMEDLDDEDIRQVVVTAANNWLEHCTLTQLREVLGTNSTVSISEPDEIGKLARNVRDPGQ